MTERDHEIIGVVSDSKNSSLQSAAEPALYHTLALGAPPAGLLWMVMRQGLVLAVAGSLAGLAAATAAAWQTQSMLFGVAPADPLTLTTVATLTMTIALLACLVPAWRASRTEPLAALKE